MNKTSNATRLLILKCLTDGMSIRGTSRVTGSSKGTILRLLDEVGTFCDSYQYEALRGLATTRVECDEQWSFVGAKEKNATKPGQGDLWTYCAIDSDSKLVISWLVGARNVQNTNTFARDLAARLTSRVQLTTDGYAPYLSAMTEAFDEKGVDFAQLVKSYGTTNIDSNATSRRYSPASVTAIAKVHRSGNPVEELVSTSYVERLNLNTRQNCRRFTRLTNAFSKKAVNHMYAVAIHFFVHNYVRPHGTLTKAAKGVKTTPAMAAGLTNRVWGLEDLLARLDPNFLLH